MERVEVGEKYYYIKNFNNIGVRIEQGKQLDELFFKKGNYYKSYEMAKDFLLGVDKFKKRWIKKYLK